MLWSGSTKIELFGHAQQWWYRMKDANVEINAIPMMKYGGIYLMLFGCFKSAGPEALVKVNKN